MTRFTLITSASAIALALVASSGAAHAQDSGGESNPFSFDLPLVGPTTFSLTSTSMLRYVGDNYSAPARNDHHFDDFFFFAYERFDLALTSDKLRIDARIDSFLPFFDDGDRVRHLPGGMVDPRDISPNGTPWTTNPDVLTRRCAEGFEESCSIYNDYARLERLTATYTDGDLTLQFGDVYTVLGRGIALTFRKTDLLGIDNAIRGGRIGWHGEHFDMQAVAGVANPQNIDPKTFALIPDPNDAVVGAEMNGRVGPNDDVELGFAASNVTFQDNYYRELTGATRRAVSVAGWHLAAPALFDGKLALYGEVDALRRQQVSAGATTTSQSFGRAVYGSAQVQLDELTVLTEWIDYNAFQISPDFNGTYPARVYSSVPTLELDSFLDVRNLENRRGGSVKVDYAFLPGPWSFSVDALVLGLPPTEIPSSTMDPWQGNLATHGWVALHKHSEGDWSLDILGGYRRETRLADDIPAAPSIPVRWHAGDWAQESLHGKIEASVAFGEHSFELSLDQRWDRQSTRVTATGEQDVISRGGVSLTYSWGIQLAVSLNFRWDNYFQQVASDRALGAFYPSVEAKWTFSPGNFVSAFLGTTPGGRMCSGGVCRDVPLFEGGMLQLVLRL